MASRKITHVGLALIILTFMVTMWSALIFEFDSTASVNSGALSDSFSSYNNNLDELTNTLNQEVAEKVDNQSDYTIEENQLLEDRAADTFGILNLFSKNILVAFFSDVADKLGIDPIVLNFFIVISSFMIIMIVLKAFWGESKV